MSYAIEDQRMVDRTADFVRLASIREPSAHDFWHIERVRQTARRLCFEEGGDLLVVELIALLHEILDWKFSGPEESKEENLVRSHLHKSGASTCLINQVLDSLRLISYRGAGVPDVDLSLEVQIVRDADRLDAIGAIGIARAFAFGGRRGEAIYEPSIPPTLHDAFEQYKKGCAHSINHFYEKLLLLKDRMHTESARRMAQERHAFLVQFLGQFLNEWAEGVGFAEEGLS